MNSKTIRHLLLVLMLLPALVSNIVQAAAGDENWDSHFFAQGFSGSVRAVAVVGNGDIYVAGQFVYIGDLQVNHIAKWDNITQHWVALGAGVNDHVNALTADNNGNLYVGGRFTEASGTAVNNVARWDSNAQQWVAMDQGVDALVNTLSSDNNGDIYAGGAFTDASGVSANRIAKWNVGAQQWQALASGVNDTVYSLSVDGNNNIYVGGNFTSAGGASASRAAKWDNSLQQWLPLGAGLNNRVLSVSADISGNIYAGGWFTTAGGAAANRVARWDVGTQQWSALGLGVNNTVMTVMADGNGDAYVGGYFTTAGGVDTGRIAKWDAAAQQWLVLNTGMDKTVFSLTNDVFDNIFAVGDFSNAGASSAKQLAKWDGNAWSSSYAVSSGGHGLDDRVWALTTDSSGNAYAGGNFLTAGATTVNHIAKWDTSSQQWQAMGAGMNASVSALAIDNAGTVYAGGNFTNAGGVAVDFVARWDSTTLQWQSMNSAMNGSVHALVVDSNGDVYAAGNFTTAGGVSANRIAKWDSSTQQWQGLGTGMSERVDDLAIDSNDDVYAVGEFTVAGSASARYVAKWDNSIQQWQAMGSGLGTASNTVTTDGSGHVYVGGSFKVAGVWERHVLSWNDSTQEWQPLTAALDFSVQVLTTDSHGDLYVGSSWAPSGSGVSNYLLKWETSNQQWVELGSGVDLGVLSLATDNNNNLYVGGKFSTAGAQPSSNFARWNATPGSSQPAFSSPAAGSTLNSSSETFTWSANGTDVTSWWLYLGASHGARNYHNSGSLAAGSTDETATGLPENGSTIHATLWYQLNGSVTWHAIHETYQAATSTTIPSLDSPVADSQLAGSIQLFSWQDNDATVSNYWLSAGSSAGADNYYNSGDMGDTLQVVAAGLPTDGSSTVHVRLWYRNGSSAWLHVDQTYTAGSVVIEPQISSPAAGSTLPGSSALFSWSANGSGATQYWLSAGSTEGASNYYSSNDLGNTLHVTATGLPTDASSTVYVRLWYQIGSGSWLYVDQTYTAGSLLIEPEITSPAVGATLAGAIETFSWSANGSGASNYWLYAGSTQGGSQYHSQSAGSATSASIITLPSNGSSVWVRLWYQTGAGTPWQFIDRSYTASGSGPAITSHASGATLASPTETFTWFDPSEAITQWWLFIGDTTGGKSYEDSGSLGTSTIYMTTQSNLPTGGVPVYVRLWYQTQSAGWQYIDQSYLSAP